MPLHLECLSHTPLQGYHDPDSSVVREVEEKLEQARQRVENFNPDLIVLFGPDHYNGFFYDLMPPFCIGTDARSVGDFATSAGELRVPLDLAVDMTKHVLNAGVDTTISYRMMVDHGFAQSLEILTGGLDRYPVIPVFVNSVAPPFAPCQRIRLLGDAIGQFLTGLDQRVLIVGSGGLSHEPPVPEISNPDPNVVEKLINGRNPTEEARQARQERVIAAAERFARGDSDLRPLNPEWDRDFMDMLRRGALTEVDGYSNEWIAEQGGKSAHEVRCWIAAFAALAANGPYQASTEFYRPIEEWIAGFAIMQANPAG